MTSISIIIYLLSSFIITILVGKKLHKHGYYFVEMAFKEKALSSSINNLLLVGYITINSGYFLIQINNWPTIFSLQQLLETTGNSLAYILILLGLMHAFNISFFILITLIKSKYKNLSLWKQI